MNMFIRSHAGFEIEAEKAKSILRKARVVASDETGVRIEGTNSYHWVFHCKDAVVHQPDYSRGARVVEEMMGGHGNYPPPFLGRRYLGRQAKVSRMVWKGFASLSLAVSTVVLTSASAFAAHMAR